MPTCPQCEILKKEILELRKEINTVKNNILKTYQEGGIVNSEGEYCKIGTDAYYREMDQQKH